MTSTTHRRKEVNEIQIAPLVKWLILAVFLSSCGLVFVYLKNQQHFLGSQTREVERQIREVRSQNEVLLARISALTSRSELQRKLEQGFIALKPIQDHCIARLLPPAEAAANGLVRTAANERFRP